MKTSYKSMFRLYFMGFMLMSLIFVAIYHPYIWGGRLYAYTDIGCDTIDQYLPRYSFEINRVLSGEGDGYSLIAGLGQYTAGLLTKYLNPSNIILLLFGAENLNVGIVVATFVRYSLILFFGLSYFLRIIKESKVALICALLWSFSSYNVLWGQHYQFLTYMVGFTASMYGFQLFLDEDRKAILAVACLSLLMGTSYYFTYNALIFMAFYGTTYLLFKKKSSVYILKKVGLFAVCAFGAALISIMGWLPSIITFFESARTEQVAGAVTDTTIFYSRGALLSFVARLLSTNLLGIGIAYAGPTNYYEAPIFCGSVLFLFSLTFLVMSKLWKKVSIVAVSCLILLCMPLTSQILVFTEITHRWTYILTFLQVLTIGVAINEFLKVNQSKKHYIISVLLADIILFFVTCALVLYHFKGSYWLSMVGCVILLVTVIGYHVCFVCMIRINRRWIPLLTIIVVELIIMNYPTVNQRGTITVSQWNTSYYNDGTEEAVQWLKEYDKSLYRVNKTYYSVSKADSIAQNYEGMGVYSSTNSKHLLNLARSWGYEDAGHWLGFDGNDWLANDLLGVKYILSKSDVNLNNGMLNLIYDNGKIRIWENVDWSGFGYLCWDEIPDPYEINDSRQRLSMFLTKSYYRTGNQGGLPNVDINQVDLIPYLQEYYDCDVIVNGDGISITSVGIDAQLIFSIPKIQNIYGADIHMELECSESGIAQVFSIAEGENYSESNSYKVAYESGKMISTYRIPSEQAVSIRLDPTMVSGQKIQLEVLNLEFVEEESLQEQQKKQVESVDTLVLQEDTFRGVVTNTRQEEAMLCIPVIYSNFWKAEVDGIPVSVENINGGLVGMSIPSGTHNFTLSYDNTVYEVARIVNVVAIVIYVVILAKVFANQKKNQKNTK